MKKQFKEIEAIIEKDVIYSEGEIFNKIDNYFKQSYKYARRSKNGVKGYIFTNNKRWGSSNFCFYLIDSKDNYIEFSKNIQKKQPKNYKKIEVTKAFRTSIEPEILKFKKNFIPHITRSQISRQVIGEYKNMHVDHFDDDFRVVVNLFLKRYNKSFDDLFQYVEVDESVRSFNNQNLIKAFIKFHNSHTNLRFVTKQENLKRKKS